MKLTPEQKAALAAADVLILRGVSGAGKTTLAKELGAELASADEYFTDAEGVYRFDAAKLPEAHKASRARFDELVAGGADLIAVDNQNTDAATVRQYYEAAVTAGRKPLVVTLRVDPETAAERTTHNVPAAAISRAAAKLDAAKLDEFETLEIGQTEEETMPPKTQTEPPQSPQTEPSQTEPKPVDTAAINAELESYRSSVGKAETAARLRAIESRIPGHVPEGARKLIARGVLAQLGTFAIDLETLDAKTPQQITDAIAAAGLDALLPKTAPSAPPTVQPNAIVPPTPTAQPHARSSSGRIAGSLYATATPNPVADALAALMRQS